jgi:GTP-binding protein Era
MKSGFVSIIGRPNVGKSTLLNSIITEHVAITSDKAGTTRNIIQGIYNEKECQIVFVDTPGIGKPQSRLGKVLNKEALNLTKNVDAILFVVDLASGIGKGDEYILNLLKGTDIPVILVMNKIDCLNNAQIIEAIDKYKDMFHFSDIVPISAKKHDNIERLVFVIKQYLTDTVLYFPQDEYTSNTLSFMVSEIVREKILNNTEEEVPHGVTCYTVKYEDNPKIINISVDIIVDRDSIKKIIIGKGGLKLKEIGTLARKDIEQLVGKKVYLELFVKTLENWKEKEKYLIELGFVDKVE